MNIEMLLLGVEDLESKINDKDLLTNPARKLMSDAGKTMQRKAKQLVNKSSGRASRNITTIVGSDFVKVAARAEYAVALEFGHSQTPGQFIPGLGLRLKKGYVRAKPYWRPALGQTKDKMNELMQKARDTILQNWKE